MRFVLPASVKKNWQPFVQPDTPAAPRARFSSRQRSWVWFDQSAPQWEYSVGNPPPLTSEEKRLADQKGRSEMVTEALAEGGERAADFRRAWSRASTTSS